MGKAGGLALVVLAVVLTPVLAIVAIGDPPPANGGLASASALSDIPAELLGVYQAAAQATCPMPWQVLAAVGKQESDHGRSTMPGVASSANFAGASGPMQFLAATWSAYGVDGDGDGDVDVYDPLDAIWGAAKYLCASGAGQPERIRGSLYAYNPSPTYVTRVLAIAAGYTSFAAGSGGILALLAEPNLTLTPNARADLQSGSVDQRVVDYLAWATQRHTIAVSVIRTGHDRYVSGTDRISDHFACEGCPGRAVDIFAVDGVTYSASCGPCRTLTEDTIALAEGRPDQIGQPWPDLLGSGTFSDGSHQDHLHAGWRQAS